MNFKIFALSIAGSAVLTHSLPAHASIKTFAAGAATTAAAGLASGTSAASVIGLPAAGAIALGGAGVQVGLAICGWFFDPPNTAEAGTPVNISTYLAYTLPDVFAQFPGISTSLGAKLNALYDTLDGYVASVRAAQESLNRFSGAILLGNSGWASDRLQEANSFKLSAFSASQGISLLMADVLYEADSISPSFGDIQVTLSDVFIVRDNAGIGIFPSIEEVAISSWNLTADEYNLGMIQGYGGLTDADIEAYFIQHDPVSGNTVSIRQALTNGANECQNCPEDVPAPLPILGIVVVFRFAKKLRNRSKMGRQFSIS